MAGDQPTHKTLSLGYSRDRRTPRCGRPDMSKSIRLLLALVAALVITARPALSQSGAATLTGLIVDESGGALPGATVTATNVATGVPSVATANETGAYTIAALLVGTYSVKVELTGFRTTTQANVTLEARQVARLNFRLAVGPVQETLEVSGSAPILQTETTTVGEVLSGNTVQSLPLNGRNTGQLTLLLPGTITYNPRGFTNIGSVNMNRPFVNGNREQTNNFIVDGFDVNETIDNRVSYQPSPDAIAEISVETNNYSADTGNVGGAVVSSVIKSGTTRSAATPSSSIATATSTRTRWENNRSGAPKQERRQHIYGVHDWRARSARKGVRVRQLSGIASGCAGFRHGLGRAPGLAPGRPVERRGGDSRSADRPAVPGQPDPVDANQRGGAGAAQRSGELSAARTATVPGGISGNFVGETLLEIRAHQGDARVDWSRVG